MNETGVDTLPIKEKRTYRVHRSIERNSGTAKKVKRIQGYTCKACDFNFEKTFGKLGNGFIEAHHLTPLSTLPEGEEVPMDPELDFAVLCSNCHRMMHRKDSPNTVDELKSLLKE